MPTNSLFNNSHHSLPPGAVVKSLGSNSNDGLDIDVVQRRQVEFGLNEITAQKSQSVLKRIFQELINPF